MSILKRFTDAWSALLGKPTSRELSAQQEIVSLRRERGRLDLELGEALETLAIQRSRLEQMEADCSNNPHDDRLGALFHNLATPLSQLRMQEALMSAGKEISGRSVMALAGQVASLVENAGLEPMGANGQEIPFDPSTCEPLAADASVEAGTTVVITFIGYRHGGRIVRKALVKAKDGV